MSAAGEGTRQPPRPLQLEAAVGSKERAAAEPESPRTPGPKRSRNFGEGAESQSAAKEPLVPAGLMTPATPDRRKQGIPARPGANHKMLTPEVKTRSLMSPPSGPAQHMRRVQDEIDAALTRKSLPLLCMALARGHCCSDANHCIHEAVRRQQPEVLEFLLQNGGSQHVDSHCCGRRPLHVALQACLMTGDVGYRMATLLLQHGARPDYCPGDSLTMDRPLHDATKRGCAAGVELLLEHNADPDAADMNNYTPLHLACRQATIHQVGCHEEVVKLLLRKGACPFMLDIFGITPLRYALDWDVRKLILQAEHSWSRCSLVLINGANAGNSSPSARTIGTLLPEVFEVVLQFL